MNHRHTRAANVGHPARAAKPANRAVDRADIPPEGYRLVDDAMHYIGPRDMVFFGRGVWHPARRAGESGSFRRDSTATAVAVLAV